jgi:hypothetical protein
MRWRRNNRLSFYAERILASPETISNWGRVNRLQPVDAADRLINAAEKFQVTSGNPSYHEPAARPNGR